MARSFNPFKTLPIYFPDPSTLETHLLPEENKTQYIKIADFFP